MNQEHEIDDDIIILREEEQASCSRWRELLFLQILMLTPVIWVITLFWILRQPITTQLAFQLVTLLGLPTIYMQIHKIELARFFTFSASKETFPGLILLLISYLGIFFPCYYLCEYTDYINFSVLDSFKSNYINLIVAGLLLAVSNPFLEEFFWRGFCPYVLQFNNEISKWYLALNYGFYHYFVIYLIVSQPWLAVLGFASITVGGRVFFFTRDKYGLFATCLFHMGADLAIISIAAYYSLYK